MIHKYLNKLFSVQLTFNCIPFILSYFFGRISVEWYLLSRFNTTYTSIYKHLWINNGYIIAAIVVLTFYKNIKNFELINVSRSSNNTISGWNYLFALVIYSLGSFLILIFFLKLNYFLVNGDFDIGRIFIINLLPSPNLLKYFFFYIILLFIFQITKLKFTIIKSLTDILLFYSIGRLWSLNELFSSNLHGSFFEEASIKEVILIFTVVSLYLINKISLFLLEFHLGNNNISDWKSINLSSIEFNKLLSLFYLLPITFFYLLALYN